MHTFEYEGSAPPLLFLHGWGQSHEALKPLADLFFPDWKPCLVDLPGFGGSKAPENVWSAYDYADALVRYLDMRKIEKLPVIGHSFGGKVASCMALRYPGRVEKLILMASSGIPPRKSLLNKCRARGIGYLGKLTKIYDRATGGERFRTHFAKRFGSSDYLNAGKMRPILVKSVNEDLSGELPRIGCKTLLLWGGKDTETPSEMGMRFAKLIPCATLRLLPYHDHQLFSDAGAHLCATYISSFLREGGK